MNAEEEISTAAAKRILPVRDLAVFGMIIVLLGLASLLYSSRSSTPEVYQFLAAALVIIGLGTFAKIPQQRRAIREAKRTAKHEQV
jgi:protein-S-isoprenylcysteine O-methyltransferase Ste14